MTSGGDGSDYDIEFYSSSSDRVFLGLRFTGTIPISSPDMVSTRFLVPGFAGFATRFLPLFAFDCFDTFFFGVKPLKDAENSSCGEHSNAY